jgi:7-carboxy-7-deazaguanine synthase
MLNPVTVKDTFPVMEMFYTIQGEGFNTGMPAFFIRLGGCDVGCHWCDVPESWNAELHPLRSLIDILTEVKKYKVNSVVITGGEPAMYDLTNLCLELKKEGIQVFLETSGAYRIRGVFDWICVSPKKFKAPLRESLLLANELKVVVFNNSDFVWAEQNADNLNESCFLYLQPEWGKQKEMLPLIIEYVKSTPKWKISVQTHKWMGIP